MRRKLIYFFSFSCLVLLLIENCHAQQPVDPDEKVELEPDRYDNEYKKSIILEMGRPFALANNEFSKNYKGLYYVKGSLNFIMFNNFLFGGYIGSHVLDNTKFDNIRNPNLKTEITKNANVSGGLQIGYDKKIKKKEILIAHINIGYSGQTYKRKRTSNNEIISSYEDQGLNLGATFQYGIFIEDNGAVLAFLTYQYTGTKYDPELLELSSQNGPTDSGTQTLSFGLVFNFGF